MAQRKLLTLRMAGAAGLLLVNACMCITLLSCTLLRVPENVRFARSRESGSLARLHEKSEIAALRPGEHARRAGPTCLARVLHQL